jgi:L-threonylcarbamoyladenylate synthase
VVKQLGDAVDLVLDAGPCQAGLESTVVDVRGAAVRVLRPGAVDAAALRAIVPEIQTGSDPLRDDQPRASPGMDARHYAPRASLRLAPTREEAVSAARTVASTDKRVGLVVRQALSNYAISPGVSVRSMPPDPVAYAHLLYAVLHELDESGVDVIVVQDVPEDDAWVAIADRLRRAAKS